MIGSLEEALVLAEKLRDTLNDAEASVVDQYGHGTSLAQGAAHVFDGADELVSDLSNLIVALRGAPGVGS